MSYKKMWNLLKEKVKLYCRDEYKDDALDAYENIFNDMEHLERKRKQNVYMLGA